MTNTMEMEIKLTMAKTQLSKFLHHPLVKQARVKGSQKKLQLENYYYDTQDFKLSNNKIAYRIRKTGRNYEATIKTQGESVGGFSARQEYTVPLLKKQAVLTGFAPNFDLKLQTLLAEDELRQLFTIKVQRQITLLQVSEETVLELAEDTGEIIAEGQKEAISEVELEIKKGQPQDLFAFVAKLAVDVPLFIEPNSKFARGLHLLAKGPGTLWLEQSQPSLEMGAGTETECKALLNYYLSNILAKQNLLRGKTKNLAPDKLLLADWWSVLALWYFILPLLPENIYKKYCKILTRIITPLEELFVLRRADKKWQNIAKRGKAFIEVGPLAKQLATKEQRLREQILALIRQGNYTSTIFALLYYLQQSSWQKADYLLLEQFVNYRFKNLGIEFSTLDKLQEDAELAKQLLEKVSGAVLWAKYLKLKGVSKKNLVVLKHFYNILRTLNYDVYGEKILLDLQRGNSSRQLAREVGILLGYRLRGAAKGWNKLRKNGQKLQTILTKV